MKRFVLNIHFVLSYIISRIDVLRGKEGKTLIWSGEIFQVLLKEEISYNVLLYSTNV